ncbi:uncharacterized protein LOC126847910 isoform X2 [Adelges cooleyi]|uniref:uncharacterized protein LOC126847910 isoform X2 n=1 Tax=Adelges cooleyi TaxID=133065 RepID=UPI0021806E2F|nr:uncharacterized protein LOC126847910 isoform X2 [Adelges cooleyi]
MKLYCISISLVFVKLLAIVTADYRTSIFVTNLHIKLAFETKQISLMLAIPECTRAYAEFRDLQEPYLIAEQEILQGVIVHITGIPVPQLVGNEDIENHTLDWLGHARRLITSEVTTSLAFDAIGVVGSELVIREDFTKLCRLIGLFRSIKFPDSLIQFAEVDIYGTCSLTTIDGREYKYRRFSGITVEVQLFNITKVVELFIVQLNNW